ncbi:hypothetical protein STEG23_026599 [Scotinomys teguina]
MICAAVFSVWHLRTDNAFGLLDMDSFSAPLGFQHNAEVSEENYSRQYQGFHSSIFVFDLNYGKLRPVRNQPKTK